MHTRGSSRLCLNTAVPFKQSYIAMGGVGTTMASFNRATHFEEVEDHLCRLRLEINYQKQELIIFLTKQYNHRRLIDAQVYFVTNMLSLGKENFTLINSIETACSENQCELELIHDYLPWMIEMHYNDLKSNIVSWVEQRQTCHVNDMEGCTKHQCEIVVDPDKDLFGVKPICLSNDTMSTSHLTITYDISHYLITQYVHFRFDCHHYQCLDYDDFLTLAVLIDTYHYVDELFITAGVFHKIDESEENKIELEDMFDLIKSLAQTTTTEDPDVTAIDHDNEVLTSHTAVTTSLSPTSLASVSLDMNESRTHSSSITTLSNITHTSLIDSTTTTSSAVQFLLSCSLIYLLFLVISSYDVL